MASEHSPPFTHVLDDASSPEIQWGAGAEGNSTPGQDTAAGPSLSSQPNRKRKRGRRPENARSVTGYPRKRALAACRQCRARKVKCNNARPSCGSCTKSDAVCDYGDPQDVSAFDSASIVILDRLDQVLTRLDQLPARLPGLKYPRSTGVTGQLDVAMSVQPLSIPQQLDGKGQVDRDQGQSRHNFDDLRIPPQRTSPDAVLAWPMLEGLYPEYHLANAIFEAELDHNDIDDDEPAGYRSHSPRVLTKSCAYGIDEDEIPELVKQFLACIHSKNPILDVDNLWVYADRIVETGLRWDPASCLVLLVCALGCVAQPFILDESSSPAGPAPRLATSLETDAVSLQKSNAYYKLASRRFGLLTKGILAPQCHFLAGVYLMHTMAPLRAWSQFHSASRACHIYLLCEARRQCEASEKRKKLGQRIYWSCYKSECELRVELDLPNSSLADLEYPDPYPVPPDTLVPNNVPLGAPRALGHEEETWYYYLTDITLRRMGNRICSTLYAEEHASWDDKNMPFMVKAAEEFERKFEEWYNSRPAPIRFSDEEIAARELPYLVQGRVTQIKTWLYRPFLYYAIHNQPDSPHRASVQHLVDKALAVHLHILKIATTRFRTHGTWYGLRESTAAALALLAAARCETILMPPGWRESVCGCIERMEYWENEVPGVARSIQILKSYL